MKTPAGPARRTARVACAAVLLPLVLASCGSGRDPLTYGERDQADSTEVQADRLAVLNMRVLPPADGEVHAAGGDARLALHLVNESRQADALVSATTDAAASVVLVRDGAPTAEIPVPALGTSAASDTLVLRGLTRELRTGQYVTVRLVFRNAPSVESLVPVSTPEEVRPRASANPDIGEPAHGGGGEGGHGSGGSGRGDDSRETGGSTTSDEEGGH